MNTDQELKIIVKDLLNLAKPDQHYYAEFNIGYWHTVYVDGIEYALKLEKRG